MNQSARKWRRIRRSIYASFAAVGLCLVACCWIAGGFLIAPANHSVGPPPEDLAFQSTSLQSESGSEVATWYLPATGADATIILAHGIRGDRRAMLAHARILHQAGYGLVLIDLQAHGESPGENITVGWLERHDVTAAVKFVRAQNPDHAIGILGRSLGGAAALLTEDVGVDAMVIEAVFPTLHEAVMNRVAMKAGSLSRLLAPALLCQMKPRLGIDPDEIRPINHIGKIGCPLLVFCGSDDRHTTVAESLKMFFAAEEPKKLVVFEGAGHEDLLRRDPEKYKSHLLGFFDCYLNLPSQTLVKETMSSIETAELPHCPSE